MVPTTRCTKRRALIVASPTLEELPTSQPAPSDARSGFGKSRGDAGTNERVTLV